MRNILIWVGIVALSLQDYFKKQPVKTTRQQQFFETGGTSQAFIEGTLNQQIKVVTKELGKPFIKITNSRVYNYRLGKYEYADLKTYIWTLNKFILEIEEEARDYSVVTMKSFDGEELDTNFIWYDMDNSKGFEHIVKRILKVLGKLYETEDYKKLNEMIYEVGDWELALQIAKGQGLI